MSNPLKKLAGETAMYGISSVLGRAVNFLLIPLYTAIFSASEYGVVGELYTYAAVFNVLYLLGLETAYFRFSNKWEGRETEVFNISQTAVLLSTLFISGGLMLFASPLSTLLQMQGNEVYIVWFAAIMGVDALVAIPFAQLRFQHKAKQYALLKLLNIFVNVGLNLFFLLFCKDVHEGNYLPQLQPLVNAIYDPSLGVGYVFAINLVANALYIPLLLPSLRKWRIVWDMEVLKTLLRYAYPLMFASLAGIVNETLDRGFLKYLTPKDMYPGFDNQAVVGIYNACYKLSIFMSLGIQAFRYAAEPFFFAREKDQNSRVLFATVMDWFVIAGSFIFLFISLNVDWISALVLRGTDFRTGLAVVPILLLANLFLGVYYNLSVWFKLSEKTNWGTLLAFIGAFITITGNVLLIPAIGYMGSAYTTLACYATMAIISFAAGQRFYPIPYRVMALTAYIVAAVALYYAGVWLDQSWFDLAAPTLYAVACVFMQRRK